MPLDIDHVANADSDAVVAQVNSMSGFFFGGGDQYRYLTTLLHGDAHTDSKVLAAIRAKLAQGAVVSGSSVSAQIVSGPDMVSGGESYEALRDGSAPATSTMPPGSATSPGAVSDSSAPASSTPTPERTDGRAGRTAWPPTPDTTASTR